MKAVYQVEEMSWFSVILGKNRLGPRESLDILVRLFCNLEVGMACFISTLGNDGTVCKDFRNTYMYILYLHVVSLNINSEWKPQFSAFSLEIMRIKQHWKTWSLIKLKVNAFNFKFIFNYPCLKECICMQPVK